MSTKTVNVCVNFWCKFQKAGAINIVVAINFPSTPRIINITTYHYVINLF